VLEKTGISLVLIRPFFCVVKGYVGDIGESVTTDIPFERVSTTTYPNQRGIPIEMWKMSW